MSPKQAGPRGYRVEGSLQVLILLVIGCMAAAASFTHVHNVAAAHGQGGWLAWADAVVLELMSIATGLEIRRRHRGGQPAGFVLGVLIAAVALSLSAQVVEAERSVVGWLAAALPALGFLALVKIVLSRTPVAETPVETPDLGTTDSVSASAVPIIVSTRDKTTTDTATVLHRPVRQDPRPGLLPIPVNTFTRVTGNNPAGAEVAR